MARYEHACNRTLNVMVMHQEPHVHVQEAHFQHHQRSGSATGPVYEGDRYAVWKRQEAPPYYEAPPPLAIPLPQVTMTQACCRPQHDHHQHQHQHQPLKVIRPIDLYALNRVEAVQTAVESTITAIYARFLLIPAN